jgi:cell division cycle 14
VAVSAIPPPAHGKSFFCIDNDLVYWNFFLDFGPLNLGHLYRYCQLLNAKLSDSRLKDKAIYHYCGNHPHRRANSAFLIAAWSIMYLNRSPDEAYAPFKNISPAFPPWHDATPSVCSFNLTVLDTLRGLYRARECGFFDFQKFNPEEYEYYEQVENGDLNWDLSGKFVAFAGPHATRESHPGGYTSLIPEDYVPYFKKRNVQLVVRLNKKYYDSRKFTSQGIDHMELYFIDGSNPPDHLLAKFLDRAENCDGAIAVHCKAGLGRTGCVIGCYMMKHYGCTAEEVIGWLRIVRPGSVIGPQQQWLKDMQHRMWREGELYRQRGGKPIGLGLAQQNEAKESGRGPKSDSLRGSGEGLGGVTKGMGGLNVAAGAGAADDTRLTRARTEDEESNPKVNTQGDYLRERRMQAAREMANTAAPVGGKSTGSSSGKSGGSSVFGYRK